MKSLNKIWICEKSSFKIGKHLLAIGGLSTCLSVFSLWISPSVLAEEGFQEGDKPFFNPFSDVVPDTDELLNQLEKEEKRPKERHYRRRSSTNRSSSRSKDVPDPKILPGGKILVGGHPSVISHKKIPPIAIETVSGKSAQRIITDFQFPDADILDIAKILGKLTGKNFIVDKDVKGRVSIIANAPITVGDAWRAFLTALDLNGYTLIPSGAFIRIARKREAREKQIRTYIGKHPPVTDQLITRVIPLKYVSATNMARLFRNFMPATARILSHEQTNTLIMIDTGSNIAKLEKMLKILDVEGFNASIEVIPVKYASAVEISKLIDQLLPGKRTSKSRFRGSFRSRKTKEGGVINTIIADERTNSLIVNANQKGATQVRELVAKLDKKLPSQVGGGKIHVVYLQFAEAEKIAKTLNALGSGSKGRFKSPSQRGSVQLFEGSIKVSADKATNSLVITASPSDFVTVQRVIHKLDIPRDEVYVEAVIMEMSLGKNFQFSTNVINPASGIGLITNTDLVDFLTTPFAKKGAILGFAHGNSQTFTVSGQSVTVKSVQGLVNFLQTNSIANVLATPQILTLDNQEATFETAEKIPVPTTSATTTAVTTGITNESVSLSLKIKPQINKISNFVKLALEAKLADIVNRELPAQVRDLAFATIERTIKTTVIVANKDTVVLGGLIRDSQNETVSKVPLLGDIPLLGWLFRSHKSESRKTNLLIFITPHIIRHYESVRKLLDKKLWERDRFIEKNAGGDDPHHTYRNEMIRGLPKMKDILQPQTPSPKGLFKSKKSFSPSPTPSGASLEPMPKLAPIPFLEPHHPPKGDSSP